MPVPLPTKKEKQGAFISRCMGDPVALKDFPDQSQRAGVCYSQWKKYSGGRRKRPDPSHAAADLLLTLRGFTLTAGLLSALQETDFASKHRGRGGHGGGTDEARDSHGRWTKGGGSGNGVVAKGMAEADAIKKQWLASSPHTTLEGVLASGQANQGTLAAAGKSISQETGAEFVDPGAKSRASLTEKITVRGKDPQKITDATRAGFKVDSPDQADKVVEALGKRFTVADEGWKVTPAGYFDRAVMVKFDDGMVGEVQLWHPALLDAKMNGGGHSLYEQARVLPAGHPDKVKLELQMQKLYGKASAGLQGAWKAALGSAGK